MRHLLGRLRWLAAQCSRLIFLSVEVSATRLKRWNKLNLNTEMTSFSFKFLYISCNNCHYGHLNSNLQRETIEPALLQDTCYALMPIVSHIQEKWAAEIVLTPLRILLLFCSTYVLLNSWIHYLLVGRSELRFLFHHHYIGSKNYYGLLCTPNCFVLTKLNWVCGKKLV